MKSNFLLPILFLFLNMAQTAFSSEDRVICENLEACPDFILQVINDGNHGCTGSLIRRDLVVTNLHCIPEDLRKKDAACEDRIKVFFPKTKNYDAETFRCKKIVTLSPSLGDTPITPDYAFFQIEKDSQRPYAVLNNEGFADQEEVTLFKIDPQINPPHLVKKLTCTTVQNSLANPTFNDKKSPVIAMIPCPIVPGNSGAPILSKNSEIKGVVSASTENTQQNSKQPLFEKAGYGSNFSCLDIPGLISNPNVPVECKKSVNSSDLSKANDTLLNKIAANLKKQYSEHAVTELKKLQKETKNFIFWDMAESLMPLQNMGGRVSELSFNPKCIAFSKSVIKQKGDRLTSKQVNYNLSFNKWSLEVKLDSQARPLVELKPTPMKSTLVFKPSDLRSLETIEVEFEGKKIKIPFCEEENT